MLRAIQKLIAILAFVAVGCDRPIEQHTSLQAKADAAAWWWSEQEASLSFCVQRHLKEYEVRIVRQEDNDGFFLPFTVQIVDKGQEIYSFLAHDETVFTQLGDTVFVADFSPIATGCAIVAFDLKRRRQLWKSELKGSPPMAHSLYRHKVIITIDDDGTLVV